MKRIFLLCLLIPAMITAASAMKHEKPSVQRIEPPCWWTGMETPLQLMLNGPGLGKGTVNSITPGLEITKVHKADSPNYLFLTC